MPADNWHLTLACKIVNHADDIVNVVHPGHALVNCADDLVYCAYDLVILVNRPDD